MTVRHLTPMLCLAAAFMLAAPVHAAQDGRRGALGAGRPPPSRAAEPAGPPPMPAAPRGGHGPRHDALADSVRRVQARTGGQVLSAERVPFDGRDINRVKVVDDHGRVRVYIDDPSSRRPPRPTRGNDD